MIKHNLQRLYLQRHCTPFLGLKKTSPKPFQRWSHPVLANTTSIDALRNMLGEHKVSMIDFYPFLKLTIPHGPWFFSNCWGRWSWILWTGNSRGLFSRGNSRHKVNGKKTNMQYTSLGILTHLLRMVMEPKYCAEEVIGHPNHHLRIWLDA